MLKGRTGPAKWKPEIPELDREWKKRTGTYKTFVTETKYHNVPRPMLKEHILNGLTHIGVSRRFVTGDFQRWMDTVLDRGLIRSPLSDLLFGNIPYVPQVHHEIKKTKQLEAVLTLMDFAYSASYWKMRDEQENKSAKEAKAKAETQAASDNELLEEDEE